MNTLFVRVRQFTLPVMPLSSLTVDTGLEIVWPTGREGVIRLL
jgi:hypothetical protein